MRILCQKKGMQLIAGETYCVDKFNKLERLKECEKIHYSLEKVTIVSLFP